MNTDKLIRIGIVLLGGGILLVGLVYGIDVELESWATELAYKFAIVAPGLVVGSVLVAGGVNTDKLIRIGIVLLGGGILFANITFTALLVSGSPEDPAIQIPVIAPGLAVGAVLVIGARIGKTADRGFTGACVALAGAVFLWTYSASVASMDSGTVEFVNIYVLLIFGPAGAALGAPLLVIGIRAFLRERMFGLCMMVPGAGFLSYAAYSIILPLVWPQFPDISKGLQLLHEITDVIHLFGSLMVGAAMVAVGL
ncbi:MAG: hypothetical protein EB829_04800, partial [Nitrosopumilus sp. H8]